MYYTEKYGVNHERTYVIEDKNTKCILEKDNHRQYKSLTTIFMAIFLPHGYPESVSKDYLQYQIWDSIQAFASSITGGLCTHAILKGIGVGNENASSVAATISWLLKDGSSMIGKIGFAWMKGTKLDSDCKKWRLFADIMNDAALFLDLLSGYFQTYFLPIVCLSGVLKALVGVAGGCTRAALTQHQARKNNMADVSAKDGSQETLVNLVALLFNLALIPLVSENQIFTWFLFIIMTVIHLLANYYAVKSVVIETFNEERFQIFASHYFKMMKDNSRLFLTVEEVNCKESVFFWQSNAPIPIKLGVPFYAIIQGKRFEEIQELLHIYKNCNYILHFSDENSKGSINVVFNDSSTTRTYMEALFQACYVIHLLKHKLIDPGSKINFILEDETRKFTKQMFQEFHFNLDEMHFNTNFVSFDIDLWRLNY